MVWQSIPFLFWWLSQPATLYWGRVAGIPTKRRLCSMLWGIPFVKLKSPPSISPGGSGYAGAGWPRQCGGWLLGNGSLGNLFKISIGMFTIPSPKHDFCNIFPQNSSHPMPDFFQNWQKFVAVAQVAGKAVMDLALVCCVWAVEIRGEKTLAWCTATGQTISKYANIMPTKEKRSGLGHQLT